MGLARGGTLDALSRVYVAWPALFAAVVAALALGRLIGPLHGPAWILASVGLVTFALVNLRLPGLPLLCVGVILNAVVISSNGGDMPVSAWAARKAGVPVGEIETSRFHTVADSGTSLRVLGDILPLPTPGAAAVVSLGDVLMAAGLGLFGGVAPVRARRTLQARVVAGLARPRRTAAPPGARQPAGNSPGDDPPDLSLGVLSLTEDSLTEDGSADAGLAADDPAPPAPPAPRTPAAPAAPAGDDVSALGDTLDAEAEAEAGPAAGAEPPPADQSRSDQPPVADVPLGRTEAEGPDRAPATGRPPGELPVT
ncbi:DUF5317 domain-containing protein [Frankia sp. EI5c]|uniref:DUF5317 domain-containing protein n=1 Tax=Frankia sp. EI5c TaxID=683316 RepID=UPI001F5B1FB0|nr:DUF5317 domain-containing protein [Frankia sp. EI5c]